MTKDYRSYTVQIPERWVRTDPYRVKLTAPAEYGSAPTAVDAGSIESGQVDKSAHEFAVDEATNDYPQTGPVLDCTVASERAAFFPYVSGDTSGYRLVFIHAGIEWLVWLEAHGTASRAAVQDVKALLGSWRWD